VIGGTGMLARATRWLADRSDITVVVARRASQFARGDERLVPIDADWNHPGFSADLRGHLDNLPSIGRTLAWLHEPERMLTQLLPVLSPAWIVLVLGSLDGRPDVPEASVRVATVRLGSMATAAGRRWLTDEEISAGAIAALKDGRSRVVGDLAPAGMANAPPSVPAPGRAGAALFIPTNR
jgi:hypothetical protein